MSSQPRIKRQMNNGMQIQSNNQTEQQQNPDIAKLATIGMRIRKAVSEGYNVPDSSQFSGNFRRVPLPNNISAPPSLTNDGSTVGSTSSLEEWDSYYKINNAPLQTLPEFNGGIKRKFDDSMDAKDVSIFQAKYGDLKFNEEF
ncbi:DIF1 [[Candida] subhashii]|uniref:Damage-regulated import facilitator 1 n=1 Tax=[Candida] subhashii TaxID=561895 RepID=A0A8J5R5M5_9ASCO|nr:DIF1 [[Candida] subhashii]KAG7665560.1 DIF1 [[Candida] subhashii]